MIAQRKILYETFGDFIGLTSKDMIYGQLNVSLLVLLPLLTAKGQLFQVNETIIDSEYYRYEDLC